jgi:hypothetical protein
MSLLDWLQIILGFRYVVRRAILSMLPCRMAKVEARLVPAEGAEKAE